jgi:DNA-binding MarR family transcriptional regulator
MTPSEAKKLAAAATTVASEEKLAELLSSFRLMLLQHGRVIIHESEELAMGATDIRALFFISEAADGATPKHVAEFLELSTGATTSLVDRMVGAGTLVREAHPTDRRSVILQVTPAGHTAVSSVADVYRCALARVIPEESFDAMTELFGEIAGALTAGSGCYEPATASA